MKRIRSNLIQQRMAELFDLLEAPLEHLQRMDYDGNALSSNRALDSFQKVEREIMQLRRGLDLFGSDRTFWRRINEYAAPEAKIHADSSSTTSLYNGIPHVFHG